MCQNVVFGTNMIHLREESDIETFEELFNAVTRCRVEEVDLGGRLTKNAIKGECRVALGAGRTSRTSAGQCCWVYTYTDLGLGDGVDQDGTVARRDIRVFGLGRAQTKHFSMVSIHNHGRRHCGYS
jgi:hypothetical protein